jgi:hypothetical protein
MEIAQIVTKYFVRFFGATFKNKNKNKMGG